MVIPANILHKQQILSFELVVILFIFEDFRAIGQLLR